jgi:hypothetical protein
MIRTEHEYDSALARLSELRLQLVEQRERMHQSGTLDEKIAESIGDLKSSCAHIEMEVAAYERRTARTWVPVT